MDNWGGVGGGGVGGVGVRLDVRGRRGERGGEREEIFECEFDV